MDLTRHILRLREYLPHAGIALAMVLAGVLFGVQEPGQTALRKAEADKWRLPAANLHPQVEAEDIAATAAMFVDDDPNKKQDKTKAAPSQAWHFVGTARSGDHIAAVIVMPKVAHVMRLEQGAKLPNGEEIVSVDDGVLRYTDDAGQHELRAFAQSRAQNKDAK